MCIRDSNNYIAIATIFVEGFAAGGCGCALVTLFMDLCNSKYAATQLSFLTSLSAVPRVFIGPLAGLVAEHLGWLDFYIIAFLLCLPSLILVAIFKKSCILVVKNT